MQQDSTIIQVLNFQPHVSFSDPATTDGKLWNAALKQITQSQGWSELHWGAQVEVAEKVDLLISKVACDVSPQILIFTHITQHGLAIQTYDTSWRTVTSLF